MCDCVKPMLPINNNVKIFGKTLLGVILTLVEIIEALTLCCCFERWYKRRKKQLHHPEIISK